MTGPDTTLTPRDQQADVERALVGGMLVNPSTISKARLIVNGHDFQSPNLGRLYAAILRVDADGITPDPVTVIKAAVEAGVCGGDRDQAGALMKDAMVGVPKTSKAKHDPRSPGTKSRSQAEGRHMGSSLGGPPRNLSASTSPCLSPSQMILPTMRPWHDTSWQPNSKTRRETVWTQDTAPPG